MNIILKFGLASITALAMTGTATTIQAQTVNDKTSLPATYGSSAQPQVDHHFVKKRYSIKGMWSVAQEDGQNIIKFNDDFKTKGGPDLKLYLSSNTIQDLENHTVEDNSVKLSVLKSNRGAQSYIIPADIDLSQFKSVVIHCEAFSVLWGGFNL